MNQHTIDVLQLLATMVRELSSGRADLNVQTFVIRDVVVSRNDVLELIESLMRKELS